MGLKPTKYVKFSSKVKKNLIMPKIPKGHGNGIKWISTVLLCYIIYNAPYLSSLLFFPLGF